MLELDTSTLHTYFSFMKYKSPKMVCNLEVINSSSFDNVISLKDHELS